MLREVCDMTGLEDRISAPNFVVLREVILGVVLVERTMASILQLKLVSDEIASVRPSLSERRGGRVWQRTLLNNTQRNSSANALSANKSN